jgi:hypothetical protein
LTTAYFYRFTVRLINEGDVDGVKLPGSEPAARSAVNCGNAAFDYPKRYESTGKTCGYVER